MTIPHSALVLLAILNSQPGQTGEAFIPLKNRPPNFSGAAGDYRMEVSAQPTVARVEDPVTLTVKIISRLPAAGPNSPVRDNLHLFPADIERDFFIEPLPEEDRHLAGENGWEFRWRLMPKHEGVKKIPTLEFVYYHTVGAADFRAADGSQSIALTVKPRETLLLAAPPQARARFQHIASGPRLLGVSRSPTDSVGVLAAALALPPVLCLAGYFTWRQLFPEAAERLRRRRNRALKHALKRLSALGPAAPAAQVRGIVFDYLQLHADLPPGGATPDEVKNGLVERGLSKRVAASAEALFRACDAAQFAPAAAGEPPNLAGEATHVLEQLEAELCVQCS